MPATKKAPDSEPRLKATPRLSATSRDKSAELADLLDDEYCLAGPNPPDTEPVDVDDKKTLYPTASKTDLLMACTWPWGRRVRRGEVGERTRFGSAFHQVLEDILSGGTPEAAEETAARWDVDVEELRERVNGSLPVLFDFLGGGNLWGHVWGIDHVQTEVSVAYNTVSGESRYCDNPEEETHEYLDRLPGEIPGTADLVGFQDGTLLVLDHKSGWHVTADWQPRTPAEAGQLRTLALALDQLHRPEVKRIIVAFFHAPASGQARVIADEIQVADLKEHARNLRVAYRNIGNGWLRDGEWCAHCPAWDICPTNRSALVELKRGPGPLTREKVGAIHQACAIYDQLRERLRSEMRAWVKAYGAGVRPDGQEVDIVEKEVTNLSQASILRALGPVKGAKEIARLEKLGCIEKAKRQELRAVKR